MLYCSEVITIVYRIIVKKGKEEEFKTLKDKILVPLATSLEGCVIFFPLSPYENKREFIFYEIWRNERAVENYYKELIRVLGKNSPGKIFPDKLNSFIEKEEDILHKEIAKTK